MCILAGWVIPFSPSESNENSSLLKLCSFQSLKPVVVLFLFDFYYHGSLKRIFKKWYLQLGQNFLYLLKIVNTDHYKTCIHRYRKSQNRLLKVCCVPATSAGLPRISFFFFLLQWPLAVLIKQTRQAVCAVKQSIYSQMFMVVLCFVIIETCSSSFYLVFEF